MHGSNFSIDPDESILMLEVQDPDPESAGNNDPFSLLLATAFVIFGLGIILVVVIRLPGSRFRR